MDPNNSNNNNNSHNNDNNSTTNNNMNNSKNSNNNNNNGTSKKKKNSDGIPQIRPACFQKLPPDLLQRGQLVLQQAEAELITWARSEIQDAGGLL